MNHHHAHAHTVPSSGSTREKTRVALVSVLAALLLTATKVLVGLWTGSLGVLAEALHSGLDLAAAVVTLWAVRVSHRPADSEHAYGHGKIENLSALFETVLLLATSVWIIREAITRLFFAAETHVDANLWSFLVIVLSIVVDFSRSRALMRVARRYDSQALEADALHFATDIWSSLVVLLGLGGVLAAHELGIPWLAKTDAVAALGVAVVVVGVSLRLGKKAIADLLDAVPPALTEKIATAARVSGVREVKQVRTRRSGPETFVDLTLVVDRAASLQHGHDIACRAEAAIKKELPGTDVVVHVEPSEGPADDLLTTARQIAMAHCSTAHNLVVYEGDGGLVLELHLEMDASLPLRSAHANALAIEDDLRRTVAHLSRVMIHMEPAGGPRTSAPVTEAEIAPIRHALMHMPELAERETVPEDIEIRRLGSEFSLSFRCALSGETLLLDAHDFTEKVERALRSTIPGLGRVMMRTEPRQ